MYIPAHFRQSDSTVLHGFIEQNSFGLLMTQVAGEPCASHLPFLLDRKSASKGLLIGHMARANPQWQQAAEQTVLVVFTGPHAYISPTWYEAETVVPTWNYVAVHVYGKLRLVEERSAVISIVRQFVEFYERSLPQPWSLEGPDSFVDRLAAQIVGFTIQIERIEGKWKLSQNHPQERQEKVIKALGNRSDEDSRAIAALMQSNLDPPRKQDNRR
jgi:transcriptional regulator